MTESEIRECFHVLYENIFDHIEARDYEGVSNTLLNLIRNHKDSPVLLVSGLRLTFLEKSNIPNWKGYLSQVREILHEQGFDANSVLRGLDS